MRVSRGNGGAQSHKGSLQEDFPKTKALQELYSLEAPGLH